MSILPRAHHIQVNIVGPNIEYDTPLPRLLATSMRDDKLDRVPSHRDPVPQQVDRLMGDQARLVWHVHYISIYDNLCTPDCPLLAAPAVPLLIDTDHLTEQGSILFAEAMRARNELPPL